MSTKGVMAEDLLREVGVFKMEECLADLS